MYKFLLKSVLVFCVLSAAVGVEGMSNIPTPDLSMTPAFVSGYAPRYNRDKDGPYILPGPIKPAEFNDICIKLEKNTEIPCEDLAGKRLEDFYRLFRSLEKKDQLKIKNQLKIIDLPSAIGVTNTILRHAEILVNTQLNFLLCSNNLPAVINAIYLKKNPMDPRSVYVGKTMVRLHRSENNIWYDDISEDEATEILKQCVNTALETRNRHHHIKGFEFPILLSLAFSEVSCKGGEHFWIRYFQSVYFQLENSIDTVNAAAKEDVVSSYFKEQAQIHNCWQQHFPPEQTDCEYNNIFPRIVTMQPNHSPVIHRVASRLGLPSSGCCYSPTRQALGQRIGASGSPVRVTLEGDRFLCKTA